MEIVFSFHHNIWDQNQREFNMYSHSKVWNSGTGGNKCTGGNKRTGGKIGQKK